MFFTSVLHLLPCPISDSDISAIIPSGVIIQLHSLDSFIVENAKTARYFLKSIGHPTPIQQIKILEMDKNNGLDAGLISTFFVENKIVGLLSEAGMPCIADPGSLVVKWAHQNQVKVVPHVGPSSILLALIASGMNGQQFKFNGYLSQKNDVRKKEIILLEQESKRTTQLFIETPYRNQALLQDLLQYLRNSTRILVAQDLSGPNEMIISDIIQNLKNKQLQLAKLPTIFGIGE